MALTFSQMQDKIKARFPSSTLTFRDGSCQIETRMTTLLVQSELENPVLREETFEEAVHRHGAGLYSLVMKPSDEARASLTLKLGREAFESILHCAQMANMTPTELALLILETELPKYRHTLKFGRMPAAGD